MSILEGLHVPIVQAPLAGGPSTPGLAAAVSDVGALGFLAAGYLTATRLESDIAALRALTDRPFGVNVFVAAGAAGGAAGRGNLRRGPRRRRPTPRCATG